MENINCINCTFFESEKLKPKLDTELWEKAKWGGSERGCGKMNILKMYKILTEVIKMWKNSNNINKHFNTKLSKYLIHRTLIIFIYYRTYF